MRFRKPPTKQRLLDRVTDTFHDLTAPEPEPPSLLRVIGAGTAVVLGLLVVRRIMRSPETETYTAQPWGNQLASAEPRIPVATIRGDVAPRSATTAFDADPGGAGSGSIVEPATLSDESAAAADIPAAVDTDSGASIAETEMADEVIADDGGEADMVQAEQALDPAAGESIDAPADSAEAAPEPDNLEVIEGIGPKTSAVLVNAGITTFTQLVEIDHDELTRILRDADLRMANPTTWHDQARLAATGDWDGLKQLQEQIKNGVRT